MEVDQLGKEFDIDNFVASEQIQNYLVKTGKNPISAVSEIYSIIYKSAPAFQFHLDIAPDGETQLFQCTLEFGEHVGEGLPLRTKKAAKLSCATRSLQKLYECFGKFLFSISPHLRLEQPDTMCELIRQHTYALFYKMSLVEPTIIGAERVISSIFMYSAFDKSMTAIALASGNKGIRGDSLSLQGQSVHDCHAEVICRRSFMRFLYSQVLLYRRSPESSIFVKLQNDDKLSVKEGLSFHLFISTAPCGDARVYEFENADKGEQENSGKLRFKIENGMGTVLGSPEYSPQTIDGIANGERLRTMSCSDKIMKWNVLGLQGCLLTQFMHPIYLSSITIGDKKDDVSLKRAIYDRVSSFPVTGKFKTYLPSLGSCQPEATPRRDTSKSTVITTNWNIADETLEIINSATGKRDKLENGVKQSSRLCKKVLAVLFKKAYQDYGYSIADGLTYADVKNNCQQYTELKQNLKLWLMENHLGHWQQKPEEISMFTI